MKKEHYRFSFGAFLFRGILISHHTKILCPTINFGKFLHSLEDVQVQLFYGEGAMHSLQEVLPHQKANAKSTARAKTLSVTEFN